MQVPSSYELPIRLAIDLVAMVILVFGLYYRRYRDKELVTTAALFNVFFFAVLSSYYVIRPLRDEMMPFVDHGGDGEQRDEAGRNRGGGSVRADEIRGLIGLDPIGRGGLGDPERGHESRGEPAVKGLDLQIGGPGPGEQSDSLDVDLMAKAHVGADRSHARLSRDE